MLVSPARARELTTYGSEAGIARHATDYFLSNVLSPAIERAASAGACSCLVTIPSMVPMSGIGVYDPSAVVRRLAAVARKAGYVAKRVVGRPRVLKVSWDESSGSSSSSDKKKGKRTREGRRRQRRRYSSYDSDDDDDDESMVVTFERN